MISRIARFLVALALSVSSVFSVAKAEPPPTIVRLHVEGLVCAYCAQGLIKTLEGRPAVAKVQVSLNDHLVVLYLKPQAHLARQEIAAAVEDAGFTVGDVEFDPSPTAQKTN